MDTEQFERIATVLADLLHADSLIRERREKSIKACVPNFGLSHFDRAQLYVLENAAIGLRQRIDAIARDRIDATWLDRVIDAESDVNALVDLVGVSL